jgi:hypothetical protein
MPAPSIHTTVTGANGEGRSWRPSIRCDAFEVIVLPDRAANQAAPKPPHSVLTLHLIDHDGEPTKEALRRVLAFLDEKLK